MQISLNLQHAGSKPIGEDFVLQSGCSPLVTCTAKVACHNLAEIQHLQHAL